MAFGYRRTLEEAGLEGVAPVADHRQAVPELRRFLAHSLKEHESPCRFGSFLHQFNCFTMARILNCRAGRNKSTPFSYFHEQLSSARHEKNRDRIEIGGKVLFE
jgi:hypothetical protein